MKADLSRDTFDGAKHYRRVLEQQGRVAIDAEPNEQVAIDAALAEATAYDVIGPSGVPETLLPDGTPAAGFLLAAAAGDVTISKGRMYVEGVLVQNDVANATFLTQPDAPLGGESSALIGLGGAGTYAAYLDVWEQLIDTIRDPLLRETALGGPDGALRAKTVWQLKWWELKEGATTCASVGEPWRRKGHGMLTASVGAPNIDPLPCILPPDTGFRRLENQLYRVEIHEAGAYGTLAFKWSRENGSVVAAVQQSGSVPPTTPITGPTFNVAAVGRDATLGFKKGDWVELIDDVGELISGRGELLEVDVVDVGAMTITTKTSPVRAVLSVYHPKMRRWEQRGTGLGNGVVVADGTPISLEDGVQVAFGAGPFEVGDFWTIPARVQLTPGGGTIEWAQDATGTYLPAPPRGIVHHYASLAIFSFDGEQFTFLEDCRKSFPPLTALGTPPTPPVVVNPCTLVFAPGPGWEVPLKKLFPDPRAAVDAELCFPVGEFPVNEPVLIATRGHVKVSGAGWGTRVFGPKVETVLRFEGCASVTIRDLTLEAGRVDTPIDAGTKHVNGALDCRDCDDVDIERIAARCGGAHDRGAACVAVRSTIAGDSIATGAGRLRVRGSKLTAGSMQFGILAVQQRRVTIEDNEIGVVSQGKRKFGDIVRQPTYLKMLQNMLVAHANVTEASATASPKLAARAKKAAPATAAAARAPVAANVDMARAAITARVLPPNATVKIANRSVAFRTPAAFANVWQTYFDLNAPKEFASNADILRFAKTAAGTLLTDATARKPFGEFSVISRYVEANAATVGARAIAIGGQGFTDVRVCNNTIDGFLIGVGVGVSHRESKIGVPDRGGSVTISDNDIRVAVNVLSRGARHAVFVGNARSIHIARNVARYDAASLNPIPDSDAIRVFGYFGKRLIIRDNHVVDFTNGVVVEALSAPGALISQRDDTTIEARTGKVWLVHDNVCDNAHNVINALACDHANNVR